MRKKICASAILVYVLTVIVAGSVFGEDAPVITIEEMRYDLGEVFEAESYKHTFTVKNTGTADLKIKQVKPG